MALCVLWMSASCGGKSEGGGERDLPPEPGPTPTTPRPDDDEVLPDVAGPPIPEDSGETASADDMVLVVLDEYCGACHGGPSNNDVEPGPLEFTDDIDRMVTLGIIAPFNGAFSPLVQVMGDGSMPPAGIVPRPTETEITMIRAFIDNPLRWPEPPPID